MAGPYFLGLKSNKSHFPSDLKNAENRFSAFLVPLLTRMKLIVPVYHAFPPQLVTAISSCNSGVRTSRSGRYARFTSSLPISRDSKYVLPSSSPNSPSVPINRNRRIFLGEDDDMFHIMYVMPGVFSLLGTNLHGSFRTFRATHLGCFRLFYLLLFEGGLRLFKTTRRIKHCHLNTWFRQLFGFFEDEEVGGKVGKSTGCFCQESSQSSSSAVCVCACVCVCAVG